MVLSLYKQSIFTYVKIKVIDEIFVNYCKKLN